MRPLRDTDTLLAALNESIAAPAGLVARVDAAGVLTGVTSRETVHGHAGSRHREAAKAAVAAVPVAEPAGDAAV
ncbi:hypothetical protein HY68_14910 [Streptomyces sp. AcH 505]|nr:hypothetical protein HY68_14910 [Streptomyces sp. AcH 505]